MSILLKDGTEVEDERLGRVAQLDPQNREYPLQLTAEQLRTPRTRRWRCRRVLNQGREGACVSFGIATMAIATPAELVNPDRMSFNWLVDRYHEAQHRDPWGGCSRGRNCTIQPGDQYAGTSEEAGLKVYRDLGFHGEFRWTFGIKDLVTGVGYVAPAVVGTNWYESFYTPKNGRIDSLSGPLVGGHLYCIRGVEIPSAGNWLDGDVIIRNSWGDWGHGGDARMPIRIMAQLLEQRGTASFQVKRKFDPPGLAG